MAGHRAHARHDDVSNCAAWRYSECVKSEVSHIDAALAAPKAKLGTERWAAHGAIARRGNVNGA